MNPFGFDLKQAQYIVSFANQYHGKPGNDYAKMADLMIEIALNEYGCLGIESTRNDQGFGITNSYWKSREDILKWKQDPRHLVAQQNGKDRWYDNYHTVIAKIEHQYYHKNNQEPS